MAEIPSLNLGRTPSHWLEPISAQKLDNHEGKRLSRKMETPLGPLDSHMRLTQTSQRPDNFKRSFSPISYSPTPVSRPRHSNSPDLRIPRNSSPLTGFIQDPIRESHPRQISQMDPPNSHLHRPSSFIDRPVFYGNRNLLFRNLQKVLRSRMVLFVALTFLIDIPFLYWPMTTYNPGGLLSFVLARIVGSFLLFRLGTSGVDFSCDFLETVKLLLLKKDIEVFALLLLGFLCIVQQSSIFNLFSTMFQHSLRMQRLLDLISVRFAIFINRLVISLSFLGAIAYNPRLRRYRDIRVNNASLWKETFSWVVKKEHFFHALFLSFLFGFINALVLILFIFGITDLPYNDRLSVVSAILRPHIYSCLVLFFLGTMQLYLYYAVIAKIASEQLSDPFYGVPVCFSIYSSNEMIGYSINNSFNAYVHYQCLSIISLYTENLAEKLFFAQNRGFWATTDVWQSFYSCVMSFLDDFERRLDKTMHLVRIDQRFIYSEEFESWQMRLGKKISGTGLGRQMFLASFNSLFFAKELVKVVVRVICYSKATGKLQSLYCGNTVQKTLQKIDSMEIRLREFLELMFTEFACFQMEKLYYVEALEDLKLCHIQMVSLLKNEGDDRFFRD